MGSGCVSSKHPGFENKHMTFCLIIYGCGIDFAFNKSGVTPQRPEEFRPCETNGEFDDFLKAAGAKLVVVDFSATWCGPCKAMNPFIHDLAVRYDNVVFCSVDIDLAEDVANSCKVNAMPTFQMYKKTEKICEITGTDTKKLEAKIEELM